MVPFFFKSVNQRRRELLSAYIDGRLSPKEQALAERVLQRSERARRELAELRAAVEILKQAPRVEAPRSFALTPEMVERAPETPWWPRQLIPVATAAASVFLVFTLVSGGVGLFDSETPGDSGALEIARAPSPEASDRSVASTATSAPRPTPSPLTTPTLAPQATAAPFVAPTQAPTQEPTAAPAFGADGGSRVPGRGGSAEDSTVAGVPAPSEEPPPAEPTPTPLPTPQPTATPAPQPTATARPTDEPRVTGPTGPQGAAGPSGSASAPSSQDSVQALPDLQPGKDGFPWLPFQIVAGVLTGAAILATIWSKRRSRYQA